MKRSCLLIALAMVEMTAWAYTDQEIKEDLRWSAMFEDSGDRDAARSNALVKCDFDRGRFSRIVEEMVVSETWRRGSYIWALGEYGSTNSIPFLESYCTNAELGYSAAMSILQLEGVTTNSLRAVAAFQSVTNIGVRLWQTELIGRIFKEAMILDLNAPIRQTTLDYAYNMATNLRMGAYTIDREFKTWDPTYLHSKRRLRILRAHATYPQIDFTMNYITNAINELVAYPEADLPD